MEIREILRQVRAGESDRAIHRNLGVHRATVKKYRAWAAGQGLLEGDLPGVEVLQGLLAATLPEPPVPQTQSSVEPYRAQVEAWRAGGVSMSAIHARLREQGYSGSYGSVQRFVHRLEPRRVTATVRVERTPGEEGQVDFGYAGYLRDEQGRRHKAWAFVMTLAWSRHSYVEFVFDQRVETWLELHRHAFEFFGGVPRRIVTDNLKAAVVRACWDGSDPQVQWAYRECAEHYGFVIAPCRPATPQHKGKVERGVGYVRGNFLAGRGELTLAQANREVRTWCLTTAGERIHGTTRERPLARFRRTEQAALRPLPARPYEPVIWKRAQLQRDCHVVFEQAYYSAPFRCIGQPLLVRASRRTVQLYTRDYQLLATHSRAAQPGERVTLLDHLPPEKIEGLVWSADTALARAAAVGPATLDTVRHLLDDRVVDPLPKARRLLHLAERCGPARLEAACARALAHQDPAYLTIKRILKQGLESAPDPAVGQPVPASAFVRPVVDLVGPALQAVTPWP